MAADRACRRHKGHVHYVKTVTTDTPEAAADPAAAPRMDAPASADAPGTRAALRAQQTGELPTLVPAGPPATAPASAGRPALSWIDVAAVAAGSTPTPPAPLTGAAAGPALTAGAPRRSFLRSGVLPPLAVLATTGIVYASAMALWPLHEVAPTIDAATYAPEAAALATITWPAVGSAAVGIEGLSAVASTEDAAPMASITKVVTVLAALERMPLGLGEQGPSFAFTSNDSEVHWDYRRDDQSALDVPIDGTLTQYQLFQGILLGSANNYADRLSDDIWGSDSEFVIAATAWLRDRGVTDIQLENPSGIGWGNTATPRALLQLAALAESNPVIAEIVATKEADIPGAGLVTNTNKLVLEDPGVIGVKTGTIGEDPDILYNLLSAKDIEIDGTTVRVYASVLGQADGEQRVAASRSLFTEVEAALKAQPQTVAKGDVLGTVRTMWGAEVPVVAAKDARVVLWNGAVASTAGSYALGEDWTQGADAGSLTVTGPLDDTTVAAELAEDIDGPSFWWRLTHPLELLGIDAQ